MVTSGESGVAAILPVTLDAIVTIFYEIRLNHKHWHYLNVTHRSRKTVDEKKKNKSPIKHQTRRTLRARDDVEYETSSRQMCHTARQQRQRYSVINQCLAESCVGARSQKMVGMERVAAAREAG